MPTASPLWTRFWTEVTRDAQPPVTTALAQADDLDLDFLVADEQAEPPVVPLPPPSEAPTPAWEAETADLLAELPLQWPQVQGDLRLAGLRAEGALLLCRLLARARGLRHVEHGPAVVLLRRAVLSPDADLATAAAQAITALEVREAQVEVAERLRQGPAELGHGRVEAFLQALEAIGDGRCVRTLEALLADRGLELSEPHAWRARHVVQVIRRAGRK